MEKRFKIVKGIILMEEIIERLKNKTFTQEDIENLYNYYKNSENKDLSLLKELENMRRFISVVNSQSLYSIMFITKYISCTTLYQKANYLFSAYKGFNNIVHIQGFSKSNYDFELNYKNIMGCLLN